MVFGVFFCGMHSLWEADNQASREGLGHEYTSSHLSKFCCFDLLREIHPTNYELTKNFSKILNLRFSFGWIIVIILHQLQLRFSKKNPSHTSLGFFFFDTKILLGPRCYRLISKSPGSPKVVEHQLIKHPYQKWGCLLEVSWVVPLVVVPTCASSLVL